jgi:phage shock protein PspC (stress-responsive transcriptional regulator)
MQTQGNLFTRDDTFFGVCQGLGEDLGFNPNWLRIALPILAFFWPVATIAGYVAAGVLVFATRFLFPEPRVAVADETEAAEAQPIAAREPLPLAA